MAREAQATEATAAHILETLLQASGSRWGHEHLMLPLGSSWILLDLLGSSWILLDPLGLPVKRPGQEGVGRRCDHSQVEAETSSRRETGALAQTQGDQEDQSY